MDWLKKKILEELKHTDDPRAIDELMDDIDDLLYCAHERGDLEDVQTPEA